MLINAERNTMHFKTLNRLVRASRDSEITIDDCIGDVRRAGIYTAMVREQTPLDSVDFDLIKEKPQLMAYAKAKRDVCLGGAVQC